MKNEIKRFFKHRGFSQVERESNDERMTFHHVEDDYVWKVEVGVKDNEIKYVEFIEDGWNNRPMEFP